MLRRHLLSAPLALAAMRPAAAQHGFPDRPVRLIVPFTPAGITDMAARLVARHLQEAWGQPVLVENRAGGNALIGAEAAARATPDGHTLLAVTLTHAINATLFPNAGYDLLRDFRALSVLGSVPLVVVVPAASPATDLAALVALARNRPLNGGSSGSGTPPHLGLELFRRAADAGSRLQHVPYRGGAPAVTDLVAGTLDLLLSNLPECLGQIRAGRLRPLAVTAPARHRLLPDVPTVAEAGMPGLEISNWTALLTQAAVPAPLLATLGAAVPAAMRAPDVAQRAEEAGFDVLGWDPARSQAFIAAEVARYATLIAEFGIRAE